MYFLRCELDLRASHALVASQIGRCRSSEPWVSANTNGFSFTPFFIHRSFMRRICPDLLLYQCLNCLWIVWKLSLSFLLSAGRIIGYLWARHCRFRAALHILTCMTSSQYIIDRIHHDQNQYVQIYLLYWFREASLTAACIVA